MQSSSTASCWTEKRESHRSIVYDAFDKVKETTGEEPLEVFEKAMNNIMPVLEVKARRVGGANYQVPIEVRADRRQTLGLRWLTKYPKQEAKRPCLTDWQRN